MVTARSVRALARSLPAWLIAAGLIVVVVAMASDDSERSAAPSSSPTAGAPAPCPPPPPPATPPATPSGPAQPSAAGTQDTVAGSDAAEIAGGTPTTVTRIVDGDTLYVAALEERVRLIGIDTPETRDPNRGVECFGPQATAHLDALVPPGTAVTVTFDVERIDRFGRPLAYLWRTSDGLFVNLRMVADGYATAATFPPNVRHSERFVAAAREAREAGRGLWGVCG